MAIGFLRQEFRLTLISSFSFLERRKWKETCSYAQKPFPCASGKLLCLQAALPLLLSSLLYTISRFSPHSFIRQTIIKSALLHIKLKSKFQSHPFPETVLRVATFGNHPPRIFCASHVGVIMTERNNDEHCCSNREEAESTLEPAVERNVFWNGTWLCVVPCE